MVDRDEEFTSEQIDRGTRRRRFLLACATLLAGAVAVLTPLAAALAVLLDPIRRRDAAVTEGGSAGGESSPVAAAGGSKLVRVTNIESLPVQGPPQQFPVVADRQDAWTLAENQRIGAVYLRRTDEQTVEAFNSVCPHAGCFVGYSSQRGQFVCPCHSSAFNLSGEIIDPSPSPRPLDRLDVKVEDDGSVWVAFQNFYPGKAEKLRRS